MLPDNILKGKGHKRHGLYERNLDLFKGDAFKHFNYDEQIKKLYPYEYICYDLINQAISIKSDLIWFESPAIEFENDILQQEWDEMRVNTGFDFVMQMATRYAYVFGDSPVKVTIDENRETASNDLSVCLYLQDPNNWYPDYDDYNPAKPAKSDTLLFEKEIKDDNGVELGEAYLLETHFPGKIIWTAFWEEEGKEEAYQIPVLQYFATELEGIAADGKVDETTLEITYTTNCTYSLVQRIKNKSCIDEYFGESDISLPVVSKLNSLNNYANLADIVIVTNSFPKLILSENASKMLQRIIDEYNQGNQTNNNNLSEIPVSLLEAPGKTFLSQQSYATSFIYKKLVDQMRAFEDGGRGETKYLNNNFDLEQIRKQHDIFFKSLMSELDISEVFYNPALSTGATSGTAYKRLMTITLNAVNVTKRQLEPVIKKIVFTMLQLAKNNGLISQEPEVPSVKFYDGIINDEMEKLNEVVLKVQNKFLPLLDAIQIVNEVDQTQAEEILARIDQATQAEVIPEPQLNQLDNSTQTEQQTAV